MVVDEDSEGITPEELIPKYQKLQAQLKVKVLDGIEKIDWSTLQHAHGAASDFPILLLATYSENDRDREFALQLLYETVWHQGTVYEASAYAVPFLLRALQAPETPDQT